MVNDPNQTQAVYHSGLLGPGAAAPVHTIGGRRMTSSLAAARARMIGHEGSNSEGRTLNFGDRGCA